MTYELADKIKAEHPELDLVQIEVTSGVNGYPQNLRAALIGFDSYEQAEQIAKQYDGSVTAFRQRDGWQFWEEDGCTFEPFDLETIRCEQCCDTYRISQCGSVSDFIDYEGLPSRISEARNFDEIQAIINQAKAIYEQIESLPDDDSQFVLVKDGTYVDTEPLQAMSYHEDVWCHTIGVALVCQRDGE